jgi:hypothetical protein
MDLQALAFETFGAPGITYELGSSTPFEDIGRIVPGAAEEAMRLLVAHVGDPSKRGRASPDAGSKPEEALPRPVR